MVPENILKEHIEKAIQEIDNNGIEKGAHSSTYDVLHDGKRYPPKLVISLANKYANGEILPRDTFSGGPSHPAFKLLDKLGFTIIQKNDSKEAFIDLKEEFAKWLLENAPESYKKMYLGYTQESILEKLVEIDGFFNDLNLYLVNKENVLEIIELIKSRISREGRANNPDFEKYDAGKGSGIPKAVIGKKNYFKFLDEKFQEGQTNYWVFQGNPNIYDINSALRQGHVKSWKVAAHKDSIKPGDKVILWQTGDEAGCYALGKVISHVGKIREEDDELQYYLVPSVSNDSNETERVRLQIITNLVERPILWSIIKDNPVFVNFKAGNQGTNFSATEKEFKTLVKMADTVRFSWVVDP